jgi:hypothetical protein
VLAVGILFALLIAPGILEDLERTSSRERSEGDAAAG